MSVFPSQLEQMVLDFHALRGAGETQWKKSWLLAQRLEIRSLLRQAASAWMWREFCGAHGD